jgi:putative ABC transport system substrate-binding protein
MAYGPNRFALYRRAAYYVDRILRGAAPGDLPVESAPAELTVNLVTARALGLTLPASLMGQAIALVA